VDFYYTEYDEAGAPSTGTVPQASRLEEAQKELKLLGAVPSRALSHLEVDVTGARENPDNAHGLLLIVWVHPLQPVEKRWTTLIEIGGLWRRGLGVRLGDMVFGLWVPWRRPRKPKLRLIDRMDVSPGELLSGIPRPGAPE
jgi:hypothetical protein